MIYKKFKAHLLEDLEKQRDLVLVENTFNHPKSLFEITNSDDKLYLKILNRFEMTAIRHVDQLLQALCNKHHINSSFERDWDISIVKNGIKRNVDIRSSFNSFNHESMHRFVCKLQKAHSPSYVVFMLKDSIAAQTGLQKFINSVHKLDSSVDVEAMLFEDFITLFFGEEERKAFNLAMMTFKDEMHQAIGYQITEICSSRNREILKSELQHELVSFDYGSVKEESRESHLELYNSTFVQILNNYITNNLFEVLLGANNFAYSFLTSEWLYKKYVSLDELDNTFIVAGYLKSIEQLLWEILKLVGQGRSIEIYRKRCIEISEENYDNISLPLGALEKFFNDANNNDLFYDIFGNSKQYVVSYLKAQITQWREKNRNNYFHKKRLSDVTIVEKIRKETLFLYMLILGSINLSLEQIDCLKH